MDFDKVLSKVGSFGKAQWLYTVLSCWLGAWGAAVTFNPVFTARKVDFTCVGFENTSDVCKLDPPCRNYVYNLTEFSTLVADLNLVCDDEVYIEYSMSIFFLGIFVGVLCFGALSDRFGRHKVMSVGIILWMVASATVSAINHIWQWLFLRFCSGFLGGGASMTVYVLLTETIGSNHRDLIGFIFNTTFSIGFAFYGLFAYLIYDWRLLTVASVSPALLCLCGICVIPESPRWLASKGRFTQSENVLYRIGQLNGRKMQRSSIMLKKFTDTKEKSNSFIDLMRTRVMRKRSLIQWFNWFTCSLVYYGLSLASATLGGSPYVSFALSGIIEIPANLFAYFIMKRWGRKKCMLVSYLLAGGGCLGLLIIQPNDKNSKVTLARTILAMIGKFGIASAFTGIYVYSVELIPTVVRNTGMGVCSMFARVGGIISPELDTMGNNPMYIVYTATCFITVFLDFLLPETLNKSLPETIAEVEGHAYKLVTMDSDDEDMQVFSDAANEEMDWDIGTGLLEGQNDDLNNRFGDELDVHYRRNLDNGRPHSIPNGGGVKENGFIPSFEMTSVNSYDYVDDEVEIMFDRSKVETYKDDKHQEEGGTIHLF